jgi:hypothetical protein
MFLCGAPHSVRRPSVRLVLNHMFSSRSVVSYRAASVGSFGA